MVVKGDYHCPPWCGRPGLQKRVKILYSHAYILP